MKIIIHSNVLQLRNMSYNFPVARKTSFCKVVCSEPKEGHDREMKL